MYVHAAGNSSPNAVHSEEYRRTHPWIIVAEESALYAINLPDAITLGGAYDGGASPVG